MRQALPGTELLSAVGYPIVMTHKPVRPVEISVKILGRIGMAGAGFFRRGRAQSGRGSEDDHADRRGGPPNRRDRADTAGLGAPLRAAPAGQDGRGTAATATRMCSGSWPCSSSPAKAGESARRRVGSPAAGPQPLPPCRLPMSSVTVSGAPWTRPCGNYPPGLKQLTRPPRGRPRSLLGRWRFRDRPANRPGPPWSGSAAELQ